MCLCDMKGVIGKEKQRENTSKWYLNNNSYCLY